MRNQKSIKLRQGSAALEYIVVSVFGLLFALGAIGIISRTAEEKMRTLEDKLGIKLDFQSLNPFSDDSH